MNIDTKLREGSQAIKQATRQAEFTSRSPADQRSPVSGPVLAWTAGLAVVALLAIPALLTGVGGQPSGGVGVGAAPTQPVELPYLLLDLADTELVDAYEIIDEVSGDRTGIHQVYHQELNDDSDGWKGREFLLRIQEPGTEFEPFDHYMPMAETTETIAVDGRTVTAYTIPDEEIEEGSYDLGMLQWTEAPGYEVILIPWGLDSDEALALLDGLTTISESEWDELKRLGDEPVVTTTTIVESETRTTGAVDAPDNPDGP
jgi:hypothetical protein